MGDLTVQLFDFLPDPIILLDQERTVVVANIAARDQLDIKATGKDLAMCLRHPRVLEAVDAVLGKDVKQTVDVVLPGVTARNFEMHVAGVPERRLISDEADAGIRNTAVGVNVVNDIRAVLILRDQTAVRRAEQTRADFVANASHELRSPLAALLGFIETLDGTAGDEPETRQRFLGIMMREAKRMARLIDDLLVLSRVEINEHVRPTKPVEIAAVLVDVTESLSTQANSRNMAIQVVHTPDLPVIHGEADQLFQVFRNLVENAIRYSREGGAIDISVEPVRNLPGSGQPGLVVKVTDQGEGIPQDAIPRLTERFYRVDTARSNSLGGTGLGLAIVKHILNRHRGHLAVASTLGQGSTFSVYLPSETMRPGTVAETGGRQASS